MVPSSVSKMNREEPIFPSLVTTKSPPALNTVPVGADGPCAPIAGGIVTTSGNGVPSALYSVERPVPLSAIQNGPPGPNAIPQEFFRFPSVQAARLGMSETRLV